MSSKAKKSRQVVAQAEKATFRRFADYVDICPFRLRLKIAIKIIFKKL